MTAGWELVSCESAQLLEEAGGFSLDGLPDTSLFAGLGFTGFALGRQLVIGDTPP
jgi:hypothetical protein